jgi:3-deoxy-D-manno-octulosonic-acid transferase
MVLLLYNLALTCLALLALPVVAVALLLRPRYRLGLRQRLGFLPGEVVQRFATQAPLWVHAPSVGELLATRRFLYALKQAYPTSPILLSCLTPTAYATAHEHVSEADAIIYFPLDHPWIIARVLRRITPRAFLFTETEMWPNFLSTLQRKGIPTVLISGRFSARASARYRLVSVLFTPIFRHLTHGCMQTQADADRLIQAGAPSERVIVTGNFKVDGVTEGSTHGKEILIEMGLAARVLLIGASTHPGEETLLLNTFHRLREAVPQLLLLLAPRHPQRFAEVEQILEAGGYRYHKRSQQVNLTPTEIEVFLLDTLGELVSFYPGAALTFVGGSLSKGPGGHSVIEPALAQVPVCFGPYTRNFSTVVEELLRDGGGFVVRDEESFYQHALPLFTDERRRQEVGARAFAVIQRGQGAVERTLTVVRNVIEKPCILNTCNT